MTPQPPGPDGPVTDALHARVLRRVRVVRALRAIWWVALPASLAALAAPIGAWRVLAGLLFVLLTLAGLAWWTLLRQARAIFDPPRRDE